MHFGLREGGCLMLGTSESAAAVDGDFEPIDKRHRLFRRVGPTRAGTLDLPTLASVAREIRPALGLAGPAANPQAAGQLATRALLERHTPAAVVVDAAGMVVHVHGDTSRFITLPFGSPTHDLIALANDQVRGAVRAALHRAAETQGPAVVRDGLIETLDGRRRVEIGASPLGPRGGPALHLVTFREYPEPQPPQQDAGSPDARQMADDLRRTRDELQSAMEEMQSSNEELKASHEEAMSLNEELQSSNEELETSKEEMQSLNEELVTVNAQLQAKMSELEATANDLGSLLTSTDIAVLFLDPKFRIRRYTPAVRDLLDLIPSDVGRPFVDLRLKFADPELMSDARRVLEKLAPVERTVASDSGRRYLRRALPYRTQDDRIDGVVVAFVDVTERTLAADERAKAEAALELELSAMTRLHDLADRLQPVADLPTALGEVLESAIRLFEADHGTIKVRDPQGEALRDVASRGFDRGALDAAPPIDRDFHSTCAVAIRTGHQVVAADISADPRWAEHAPTAAALDYGAAISTPMKTRRDELLGVLTVHFRAPRRPKDRDLRWADLYARLAARLVDQARDEAALRGSEERRRLAMAARMGVWSWDAASDAFKREADLNAMLGLPEQEAAGSLGEFLSRIHPDDRGTARAAFDRAVEGHHPLNLEFRVVWPSGEVRRLRAQGRVFEPAGEARLTGACLDVTELKGPEEDR